MKKNLRSVNWRHVGIVLVRKTAIIGAIYILCAMLESHHIFFRIGKTGEFVLGSITDHLLFDLGN